MAKDPYKLLGLKKGASEADIRKAYRALAKKLHPDVNPGDAKTAERFKEISAAYTLLSDKDLKAQYDRGQIDGTGQQQAPFGFGRGEQRPGGPFGSGFPGGGFQGDGFQGGGGDMNDMLASLFGVQMNPSQRGGGPQHGFGQTRAPVRKKGGDIRSTLTLDFIDALRGGTHSVRTRSGKTLRVKVPAGIEDGQVLRMRGEGAPGVGGGPPGDAKVDIKVKSHKYISREGKTLRLILPISLQEAVLGAMVTVPMPDGSVHLRIPAGSNSGKTLRLKGKGIDGGDLLLSVRIVLEDPDKAELQDWARNNPTDPDFDPRKNLLE